MAAETVASFDYQIEKDDFKIAGSASSHVKKILKQLGLPNPLVRRAAIIAYELEINLVIHTLGGAMRLEIHPDRIIILTEDVGPGIEDVDQALTEGYSTASDTAREMGFGAGMGLPNIKRCSDSFSISSKVGEGTWIRSEIKVG
jgi:anti-sigma regulatory factor (Ser/Thr protein kinase)